MMAAARKAQSDRIRTAIKRAVLPRLEPGEQVPSCRLIADACRISHQSARKFLKQVLEDAGVEVRLTTIPRVGKGMVVVSVPWEKPEDD